VRLRYHPNHFGGLRVILSARPVRIREGDFEQLALLVVFIASNEEHTIAGQIHGLAHFFERFCGIHPTDVYLCRDFCAAPQSPVFPLPLSWLRPRFN
jgi:hypothetical protein